MSLYRVHHNYAAVYRSAPIGFEEGTDVDVDDEQAAWVNHDSPGCLIPLDEADEPQSEAIEVAVGETGTLEADDLNGDPTVTVNLDELDREQLLAYADEHGLDVNRRLGEENLRAEIAAAPLPPAVAGDD